MSLTARDNGKMGKWIDVQIAIWVCHHTTYQHLLLMKPGLVYCSRLVQCGLT